MEHGFSFLFLCYHKLSYKLMIIAIVVLDFFTTVYIWLNMPPYPEEYNFLNGDVVVDVMGRLQILGGISNVVIPNIWFYFNRQIICNVEVDLSLLKVNLISDASVRKCLREMLTVYIFSITITVVHSTLFATSWTLVPMLIIIIISSSFIYGSSGVLSCSFLQLGSLYNDFKSSDKYEDSVLRYQRIFTIFEKICHLFKVPMFLIIGWSFLLTICDLYVLFNSSTLDLFWSNAIIALYIPYFQFPVLMVIRSCNELNKKAKAFNQQLYWKMVEDKSFKLLKNEKLNFHFLVNEEMIFTACGFFSVDNSLIFSMISTATTYLAIVLQYGRNAKPLAPSPTNTSLAFALTPQH